MKRSILIFTVLLFNVFNVTAQRSYTAVETSGEAPRIDGKIDAIWDLAPWTDDFTQYEPYNGKKPSQKTAFKILYDNNNLYFLIRCYDTEPDKIENRLSRRDNFEGDWVAVGIDSYDDNLTAFAFSASASGVKGDVKFSNDDNMDATWDAKWYLKTSIDEEGWIAEMRIPFNQLRFSESLKHKWGLQVIRKIFRKQETSVWNPVSKEVSGWVSHFGELKGIDNINPKKEVELIPYVMGNLETGEKEEGNPFATGHTWNYSAGLDGKIAVTNDLTLNFTVNPDFGQVEADPSEVNLSAFETYFQEKRPFFIEGNNIFSFPVSAGGGPYDRESLFYSRRIGRAPHYYPSLSENEYAKINNTTRILGAFKLSGKTKNGWSIGVMESLTNKETALIDSLGHRHRETVEPMTNFFNTRIQKDLKGGNTIVGGMITATNRFINDSTLMFLPDAAYTGGLDFTQYWKNRAYKLSAKVVASSVSGSREAITDLQRAPQRYFQKPDGKNSVDSTLKLLQGTGGSFEVAKIGKGHWRYGIRSTWLNPKLEINDQGYLFVSDLIKESVWGSYEIWEPFSIFRMMEFNVSQWSGWDFSFRNTFTGLYFGFDTQFKNYWSFSAGMHRSGYELNRHELRGGPSLLVPGGWNYRFNIGTNESKKLAVGLHVGFGHGDQDARNSFNVGMGAYYQPFSFLQVSMKPVYSNERTDLIYVGTYDVNNETVYLTSSIIRNVARIDFRFNVYLNPDLSIQYWGQPFYFSGDYYNFKKVTNPEQKDFKSQFYQYTGNEIVYDNESDLYSIDDNGDGNADYSFGNPDFSFAEFRSNLVMRWEYQPGSVLYFVWSQGGSGYSDEGIFDFDNAMDLFGNWSDDNVFLVKFSYRISM